MANISQHRYKQLLDAKQQLNDLRRKQIAQEVANEYLHLIGVVLALTPYDRWPEVAKAALEEVSRRGNPVGVAVFKELLPTE